MPLIKILKDYQPTEGWKPGQIVEITNPWTLIREGNAVLVTADGKELEEDKVLIEVRRLVRSKSFIDFVNSAIAKHPRKEEIVSVLTREGVMTLVPEEDRSEAPVPATVEVSEKEEPVQPIEKIERPKPLITEEQLKAKIEELKAKKDIPIPGTEIPEK
jgi:hypothetical protein